jgi:hypothetical protein
VKQGDSLTSIAVARGFDWQTIGSHLRNATLKTDRRDPHGLNPGDVHFINLPSKSEMELLRTERTQMQASIED